MLFQIAVGHDHQAVLELSIHHAQQDGVVGIVGTTHKTRAGERHVVLNLADADTRRRRDRCNGDGYQQHLVPISRFVEVVNEMGTSTILFQSG